VTQNTNGTWNWSYATTAGPDWIRTVTITATDDDGGTSATTFQLAINPVVQLPGGRGTNSAVVSRNGDNIQVLNNKKLLFNEPEGSFQALKILGEANKSDTLTLDFSVGGPFVVSDRIVFDAGPGKYSDTLVLRGTAGADAFTLADFPVLVGNDPPLRIELGGTEHVTLDGGAGDDTYRVSNLSTKATIVDGKGNDVLDFSAATAGVNLNLTSTSPQRIFAPTNTNTLVLKGLFENVIGSPQADIIRGNSAANRIEGGAGNDTLYGNSGDDWLYGGTGDDWLYGGAGGDNLFGESGNNVLLGGAGNDVLDTLAGADAAGRNLLIGGPGADTLQGGPGEEILIGGTTSYDNRPAVLAAVMEQWASDQAFGERFDLLDRGFKDPAVGFIQFKRRGKQSPRGTVLDDGMRDSLFGGPGSDWFLDFPNDDVRDRTLPEDR
jgi:Ca2+-binding RTX toxin-like protein